MKSASYASISSWSLRQLVDSVARVVASAAAARLAPPLAQRQAGGQQHEVAQGAAGGGDGHHRAEVHERLELAGPQRREADGHRQAREQHAGARDPVAVEQALPESVLLALAVELDQAVERVVHREPQRHARHQRRGHVELDREPAHAPDQRAGDTDLGPAEQKHAARENEVGLRIGEPAHRPSLQ